MGRYKSLIGPRLRTRGFAGQHPPGDSYVVTEASTRYEWSHMARRIPVLVTIEIYRRNVALRK
jgi:hypothetical protein